MSPSIMWKQVALVLALCASSLTSCGSTRVVIADPDRGLERTFRIEGHSGKRGIKLQFDRVRLNDRRIDEPPICYSCQEAEPGAETASFNLMFFASNDTGAHWELRSSMFHLIGTGDRPPVRTGAPSEGVDRVLASVPPYSTARIPILFSVSGVNVKLPDSQVYGEYELHVFDAPVVDPTQPSAGLGSDRSAPELILKRHLSIGRFNQGGQALRFVAFLAVALVVLGTL